MFVRLCHGITVVEIVVPFPTVLTVTVTSGVQFCTLLMLACTFIRGGRNFVETFLHSTYTSCRHDAAYGGRKCSCFREEFVAYLLCHGDTVGTVKSAAVFV